MKMIIRQQPVEVNGRLAELGLNAEILRDAVKYGELARSSCTANDPPTLPGLIAWGKTLRALREFLLPLGWEKNEEEHLSTVVNPNANMSISVATGDEATGNEKVPPKTKYPKGPSTAAAVELNRRQLSLFPLSDSKSIKSDGPERVTWLLLISRLPHEVRCELSLPAFIGEDDRVEDWAERLILEPVRLDPAPLTVESQESTQEIVIEVSRR